MSLMADENGFPLSILFMKGNKHDNDGFNNHLRDILILKIKNVKVLADKAYSSKNNYELLEKYGMGHIIPPRKNMKIYKSYKYCKKIYAKRIKIENIFGILKNYKRLRIRYDKLLRNYRGFLFLGILCLSVNLFNKL